ncbi:MAG: gliding motility-associated C-terminal domain-containing protein [Phaeodactylibacter sp.]|uniref:T9SS type B sorting domain-containing protein n=1 Tax=Phaeodactylibacter sp. TaxID=1940289 RepID=UPI0032EE5403
MNIRLASFGFVLMLLGKMSFAQNCDAFSVAVTQDTVLCTAGSPVLLSASFSSPPFAFQWTPAAGLADPFAASTTATPGATQTYTMTALSIGENLIFNGDFELGNLGFTTDYGPASGGPNGPLHNEGEYLVSDDPNATHEDFAACGDQTTGMGNMMVVNSADQQDDVWCQVVSVSPGTDYAFSAWVASVTAQNPAILQFSFDGVLLGSTVEAPAATCQWTPFYATWNSGSLTAVEICITNVNEESTGNDFALDDISFGPVCEASAAATLTIESAPDPVTEVNCNATVNSLELSWSPVAGADTYQIDVLDTPAGAFTSDTSYLITGLMQGQSVNYELFAVSAEGCLSPAFSGGCLTLNCPDYALELEGSTEVCEGSSLDLLLNIDTESAGPFTVTYTYNGLNNTLPGLQAGINALSLPVTTQGTFAVSSFIDNSTPACTYDGVLPELNFTVVPFPAAGVGKDLTFCAALDSLLDLNAILAGADPGGVWQVLEGEVPDNTLNSGTGLLNLAGLEVPGNYQMGYLQNNGICQPDSALFNFEILPLPEVVTGGPLSLDCETEEVVLGGPAMPGLSYSWSALDGGVLSDPDRSNPATAVGGNYALEVTDNNTGCTNSATVEVTDNRVDLVLVLSATAPGCLADGKGEIRVDSVTGGQAPYLFSVNSGPFQQFPAFEGLDVGSYLVRAQDGGGCEGVAALELEESAPAAIQLVSSMQGLQPVVALGDSVNLIVQTADGDPELPDSLVWEPAVCEGCANVRVSPDRTTTYTVTGITADGCVVTARIVVEVNAVQRIYVPSAFSPNDDGINDSLLPYAGPEFIRGVSFRIFNRWGGLVFEQSDFPLTPGQTGWDGQYRGEAAPGGVYAYQLVLERSNGTVVEQTGEVNLIR